MRREIVITAVLVPLAVVVGAVGWSGQAALLPAATFFPLLWARSPTRIAAAGVTRSAIRGGPVLCCGSLGRPLLLGRGGIVFRCCPFGAMDGAARMGKARALSHCPGSHCFSATRDHRLGASIDGGRHSVSGLTAGLIGLVTRIGPAIAITLSGLWLWSAASGTNQILLEGWRGVDLEMGASLGRDQSLQRQRDLVTAVRHIAGTREIVVVLPESTLGFWTPTLERFWRTELQGTHATVVAGAAVIDAVGYDNVMVAIDAHGGRVLYHERMPVPVSMWRPWERWSGETGGARASFFANPVVEVAGRKIAPLICYEQLVLWPLLQSMLYRPDAIVLIGNGWWTTGGTIVAIQRASAKAWSALFGVPLVISFNT